MSGSCEVCMARAWAQQAAEVDQLLQTGEERGAELDELFETVMTTLASVMAARAAAEDLHEALRPGAGMVEQVVTTWPGETIPEPMGAAEYSLIALWLAFAVLGTMIFFNLARRK